LYRLCMTLIKPLLKHCTLNCTQRGAVSHIQKL
jgi:hypothetical protein